MIEWSDESKTFIMQIYTRSGIRDILYRVPVLLTQWSLHGEAWQCRICLSPIALHEN